jgi:hypothetical protein
MFTDYSEEDPINAFDEDIMQLELEEHSYWNKVRDEILNWEKEEEKS